MVRHWHIVDTFLSRHVVGSVHAVYGKLADIEEVEFNEFDPSACPSCGEKLG